MGYLRKTQVPSDGRLFCEGDSSDKLYLIESGQVSEIDRLRNGKVRRLRTLGPGTILGENSFYLGTPHETDASTDRPSQQPQARSPDHEDIGEAVDRRPRLERREITGSRRHEQSPCERGQVDCNQARVKFAK